MAFQDYLDAQSIVFSAFRAFFDGGKGFDAGQRAAIDDNAVLGTITRRNAHSRALNTLFRQRAAHYVGDMARASEPLLQYAMDQIGRPYVDFFSAREEVVRHMAANNIFVAGRVVTYGANPPDNVAGIHRRLTVNRFGQRIETGFHNYPEGIKITVTDVLGLTSTDGNAIVAYSGPPSDDQNNFNAKGQPGALTGVQLVGPGTGGLASNPTLGGLGAPSDGFDITADGIQGWSQTRGGAVTVKARPGIRFNSQSYGIGVGGDNMSLTLTQNMAQWPIDQAGALAYMIPVYMSGAGVLVDIDADMGSQADSWDETDLTNGQWTPLISTLDEDLYFEELDDGTNNFVLKADMRSGNVGEAILGGVYVAQGFVLQEGGEIHFAWQRVGRPLYQARTTFGADSQTAAGIFQDLWCRMSESGPSLPVTGSTPWAPDAPSISTSSMAGGTSGNPYSEAISATGGYTPYEWAVVAGALPTGYTLNALTGVVTGTSTDTGTHDFTVRVRDALGQVAFAALAITVS